MAHLPRNHCVAIFCFIATFLFLTSHAGAIEPPAKGSVSGVIVNSDGKAIAGASVFLDNYDDEPHQFRPVVKTESASDGSFHLPRLTPVFHGDNPAFDLRVSRLGFATQLVRFGQFSIFSGADNNLGTIRLGHGQIVSGQVLDIDGKPCAGALVRCQAGRRVTAGGVAVITPEYEFTTDARGRFTTPPLPVSTAGFTVQVPGRLMPWVTFPVSPIERAEMQPIRLQRGEPITGTIRDAGGKLFAGAKIRAAGYDFGSTWLLCENVVSDADGHFALEGIGDQSQIWIQAADRVKLDWGVRRQADGIYWSDALHWDLKGPVKELSVTLTPVAWIEGSATDADTGLPVRLKRIVRCQFTRNKAGEVILNGCQAPGFQQIGDGVFRLPYNVPDEFHLTISADGYQDAEAFTPLVTEMQTISGIKVRMHQLKDKAELPTREAMTGRVMRDGKPVKSGWVALLSKPSREEDLANVHISHGRTIHDSRGGIYATAIIRDGVYTLDVPYQDDKWVIEVQEPGEPPTLLNDVSVALNEHKELDISAVHGGQISGKVESIPTEWANDTWVIAFMRDGMSFETRVDITGHFEFRNLPPGEYGLKAGHDAFQDAEVPAGRLKPNDPAYTNLADPWKRAKIVKVKPDRTSENVELELPAGG